MNFCWIFQRVFLIASTAYCCILNITALEDDDPSVLGSLKTVDLEMTQIPNLGVPNVEDFKLNYADFEKKTKLYIQGVRQGHLALISDSAKFLMELRQYYEKLPKGRAAMITIKSRSTCNCEGKRMSPCPSTCLYSCYGLFEEGKAWRLENDCRNSTFLECLCYEGSSEMCDAGVDSCFKETAGVKTTGLISGEEGCSAFAVDDAKLVQSYLLFQGLLIEPINVFIRKVESRSIFMKIAADSIGHHLANLSSLACHDKTHQTCPLSDLLKTQIGSFLELKMNVTYEMIETLDHIRKVNEQVARLREQTLALVNGLIKGYACCLRTANFTLDGIDCSDSTPNTGEMLSPLNKTRPRRTNLHGTYEWVTFNGSIPENAVEAGVDGSKLYAGRAAHEGELLPAKVSSVAYVSYNGKEYMKSDYEVLVSKDIVWVITDSKIAIPAGALQVGYTKNRYPLYMGRAVHNGVITPGKVQTSDRCLYIPYGSNEHKYCSYEIMVLNQLN